MPQETRKEVRADLHNHLMTSSRMSKLNFNRVINVARKRLGNEGVLGLVNFEDARYEAFSGLRGYDRVFTHNGNAFYVPEKGIFVVKGQEVPTEEGHLLVLGSGKDKRVRGYRSFEDAIREARDYDGICGADHPFGKKGLGPFLRANKKHLDLLDFIEVHNGEIGGRANREAKDFFIGVWDHYPHLGGVSASDGHSLYELGRNWTGIQQPTHSGNAYTFNSDLRRGIRHAQDAHFDISIVGLIGAIDHMIDLAAIIGLAKIFPRTLDYFSGKTEER